MGDRAKLQLLTRTADESAFEIFEADSSEAYSGFKPQKPAPTEWELRRQPVAIDGTRHVVLKNLRQDTFLLLNSQEHFLWQQFDGRNSLEEIARAFHLEYGAFDYSQIREFLAKLYHAGLIEGHRTLAPLSNNFVSPLEHSRARHRVGVAVDAWRRFALRTREADRYCSIIYRSGGFTLFYRATFWMVVATAILAGVAAFQLVGQSIAFARTLSTQPYLTTAVLVSALLTASMLHVLVHALACKAHGRRVRELGFFLLQGVLPTFYADVTDIFMSNRRARLTVDLAGPMVEVFLGSLAMLAAYASNPGIEQALLFGTGVLLWEGALINLYPFSFLELDGYNILADALAMPMLRKQALALLPHLVHRLHEMKPIERAELIQIGYLALCFISVVAYLALHLDAITALLPSIWW
jgi:putative peptide zinc metalloprotease protein